MNCCVPAFVAEDDNNDIFPSFFMRRNADPTEDDLAELIWQKEPAVHRRSAPETPSALPSRTEPSVWSYSGATPVAGTELFMEEDEMAAWLGYRLGEDEGGGGLGGVVGHHLPEKAPAAGRVQALDRGFQADVGCWAASCRPPLPPEVEGNLSLSHRDREPNAAADSIVVGSSMTPWLLARGHAPESRTSSGNGGGGTGTSEHGHTLSSGGFCEGDSTVKAAPPRDDRKRKAQEGDDSDCHSEDAEFESSDLIKLEGSCRTRSASKRRFRAAAVHNLSERRRRDRINEKMKALQQLIPRCNKSDKASMLDDAIEYLKALQMQVHMMSVGCNMVVPMMFPGMQQYVTQTMGMAIPMGMSMGMGMGAGALNHPMLPFLPVMSGAHMVPTGAAAAAAAAPLGTGFSMQPFHAPAAGFSDPAVTLHAARQTDPAACPAAAAAAAPAPGAALHAPDHYSHPCSQQYAGLHPLRAQVRPRTQGQATAEEGSSTSANNPPEKPKWTTTTGTYRRI